MQIIIAKDETEDDSNRVVTVLCRDILTEDPVAESWLPLNDILKCVELILQKKAEIAMEKALQGRTMGLTRLTRTNSRRKVQVLP